MKRQLENIWRRLRRKESGQDWISISCSLIFWEIISVPEKIWNKFLLTTNLVSFWNYVLPVLMLPVFIYFLPASEVVASFFLFLGFSFINGIYITCYRKATEWILKWPLILGWMGMFAVLIGYMFVASFFPVWMGWIGIFFLAGAVFAGLTIYLYHEKIYNEQKQKVSKFRGFKIGRASCRESVSVRW